LRPENNVHFLGEFHRSNDGFLMWPIKKKGARSSGGKTKKTRMTPPGE